MSDYSPPPSPNAFDELEDVLYDADPSPDLADELASHALHSPLLDFEPGYELQEYHSDWEYYSDDYYDDDPSILKTNPIDGSPTKSRSRSNGTRGRKRKLAERDSEVPTLDDRGFLQDCMKGTVWAKPVPERNNLYHVGQGEKVALLKDWKAKFGTASPRKGQGDRRKKPQLSKDESWANNLSLADMGLMNARGSMAQAGGEGEADDEDGLEGEDGEDYPSEEDEQDEEQLEETGTGDEMNIGSHVAEPTLSNIPDATSPPAARSHQSSDMAASSSDGQPNKRRRKDTTAPTSLIPSPPATNGSSAPDAGRRTRGRANSSSTTASTAASKPVQGDADTTQAPTKRTARKRKASVSEDDVTPELESAKGRAASRATAPTASSRAKRVASMANNVVSDRSSAVQGRGTARTTRSRKK